MSRLKINKLATVSRVRKVKKYLEKPKPMNSIDLVTMASDLYGMTSYKTMQIAENLYNGGLISYPRTESRSYPKGFDFSKGLKICSWMSYYGKEAANLFNNNEYVPVYYNNYPHFKMYMLLFISSLLFI